MTTRGDVLRLPRRLGFGAKGEAESVVVVQADELNKALPTLIVVPLDSAIAVHAGRRLAVPVSAEEAGSSVDHVALVHQVRAIRSDRLAPGVVGRLRAETLSTVSEVLRRVLALE
jgi:mRNA-degrading endonuclease toxin of MazEF toxin-antitoxin module